jgi:hypothetical protein
MLFIFASCLRFAVFVLVEIFSYIVHIIVGLDVETKLGSLARHPIPQIIVFALRIL